MIAATPGTKTDRKSYRSKVRWMLGTSREGAPSIRQAIRAADYLDFIVAKASGNRFRLRVVDMRDAAVLTPMSALMRADDEGTSE